MAPYRSLAWLLDDCVAPAQGRATIARDVVSVVAGLVFINDPIATDDHRAIVATAVGLGVVAVVALFAQ